MNLEEKKAQKQMAEKLLEASEDKVNRNIKDSVFCDLFGEKEYLYQLYQVLHPEDKESGPEDLTIVTLSRTIVQCIYNDLGFLVGNRLIVLVEAQSTWSENILVRFLMYLGETYRRYIRTNGLRLYNEKNIEIPRPELYVVFTGTREEKPETISLRECFFHGEKCCVDVEAKVIYSSEQDDVINQYIIFCKVFNEQFRRYPADRVKAVQETIRICKERDVLKAYLEREEAATVMFSFADQVDAINEAFEIKREEGIAEGIEEGKITGARDQMEEDAKGMYAEGIRPEVIARIQKVSVDVIENILGLLPV